MDTNQFPNEFLTRLEKIVSKEQFVRVFESFKKPKPHSFRVNTLKTTPETLQKSFASQGIALEAVPWYVDAFIVTNATKEQLTATEEYKNGHFYIQNLSSMIPALILSPRTRDMVCDLAAAPGSKTTQLAQMMRNKGQIVANDISRARLFRLKANLDVMGITNTKLDAIPGQSLWKKYPPVFDRMLIDVPCSMEGRFSLSDPDSYKDWTPKKVRLLAKLQKYLLRSAVTMTKPGGLIVYSSCTLEPEENEEVVDWVLEKEKGQVSLETITVDIPGLQPGITKWNNKIFDPSLAKTMRILPSEQMEGFYVAALRRKD